MADFGLVQEQFNNLTGDIELNPSSFGLFMRDIEEASLNLKTAIYSGNINLTADIYKLAEGMAEKKYSLITTDGQLSSNQMQQYYINNVGGVNDINMDGKNPGLYMDHMRIGYWSGTDWKVRIQNDGEAFFGSIAGNNYMHWNGSSLIVRGDIEARSISADAVITNTIRGGKTSYTDSTAGYWLGLDSGVPKFNLGNSTNSLNWDGTLLQVTGKINATSGTFSGNITSSATITGGTIKSTDFIDGVDGWRLSSIGLEMFTDKMIWLRGGCELIVSSGGAGTEIKADGLYLSQAGVGTSELYIDNDGDSYAAFTGRLKINNTQEVLALSSYDESIITPNGHIVVVLGGIPYSIPVRSV